MTRAKFPLLFLLGVGLLSGCARFHPQPLAPEKMAADFQRRSLADPGLRAFIETNLQGMLPAWPLPTWGFINLTLAALYYHPDLDVARAQWGVATAGQVTAGERPNPTLSVSPGYNTTTLTPSPWLVTPSLDIPLETAGKRGYRLAQAGHLSEAARLNLASVAWQVRSRVRSNLVELNAAQATERLLQEQQTIQAENLRLLERQHEAGAVSAFEVTQAGVAADSTRLALRDAERQSAEARVQLAAAIGVPSGALDEVKLSFDGLGQLPDETSVSDARRQALLHRSDILGALAEYAASQSALQLEIARQYPDVHFNPGYEFDQGDNKWMLGLSVTLPVLNHNQGAIAEANAKRTESAARFNALQARVLAEIDCAVAGYRASRQKQADADALLGRLQKQEQRAQAMFDAGEISKGDLAALRLQLSASALARLDALVKSQQALGQLEDALQSPLGLPAAAWQAAPRIPEFSK
jgi:outer membrane protein TolC